MSKYLILTFFLGLWSCIKDQQDTACFTLLEKQCYSDPYQPYIKDSNNASQKIKGIQDYLNAQGIFNVSVKTNPVLNDAVCLACVCPSGENYTLTLAAADSSKLKSLGLTLVSNPCN